MLLDATYYRDAAMGTIAMIRMYRVSGIDASQLIADLRYCLARRRRF